MAKQKNDIAKMTFEQAIDSLTGIVDGIETGQMPLAESIENYERGMRLIKHCRGLLQTAEKKIENRNSHAYTRKGGYRTFTHSRR